MASLLFIENKLVGKFQPCWLHQNPSQQINVENGTSRGTHTIYL